MKNQLKSEDYLRIGELIRVLGDRFQDQPDLEELGKLAALSPAHLQRLFKRWVGISPKQFLQYLTLQYTKGQLNASRSLLDASLDAGLSGPGRLHDLFVKLEAMTPGEYKKQAAGLKIRFGFHPTPFGTACIAAHERGLCGIFFGEEEAGLIDEIHREYWPKAQWINDHGFTKTWCERIFSPHLGHQSLSVFLHGTPFQLKVWEALLRIPEGRLLSYGEVAQLAGCPTATRAVASAVGDNPISYLIPCHRVIRKTGELGGYRWGLPRKKLMLAYEAGRTDSLSDKSPT